jgi:translation initiation factor 2-alpha kinase 3
MHPCVNFDPKVTLKYTSTCDFLPYQISGAVMYLHSKGMMHRDLKPSNIFFSHDGRVVLGDFGLVTRSSVHNSCLTPRAEKQQQRQCTADLGTNLYMSPEMRSTMVYDQKVDVYSLGVILFELYFPFNTAMERVKVCHTIPCVCLSVYF